MNEDDADDSFDWNPSGIDVEPSINSTYRDQKEFLARVEARRELAE